MGTRICARTTEQREHPLGPGKEDATPNAAQRAPQLLKFAFLLIETML